MVKTWSATHLSVWGHLLAASRLALQRQYVKAAKVCAKDAKGSCLRLFPRWSCVLRMAIGSVAVCL